MSDTSTTTTAGLDVKSLAKLQKLRDEINNSGEYLRLSDGQSEKLVFNLNDTVGLRVRMIQTDKGEKQVIKIAFAVFNLRLQQNQLLELSRKWSTRAINSMIYHNTTTLIVKREGSGLETDYTFLPAEPST
jgi:hypothetical protein